MRNSRRNIVKLASVLLLLIGLVHIGFSFIEFTSISVDAMWFVAGGLVFIFSGLFNLFVDANVHHALEKTVFLKAVNLLFVLFLITTLIQLPMIPGFIGLACAVFLLVFNPSA